MADIATVVVRDQKTGRLYLDWWIDGADLVSDEGLSSAIAISLFSDRRADPEKLPPDRGDDPRGWWGDFFAPSAARPLKDRIGSRFWLRAGSPATAETARKIRYDAEDALKWLVDLKIAQSVAVATRWIARDVLGLTVTVVKRGAPAFAQQFDYVWSPTLSASGNFPAEGAPAIRSMAAVIVTESGDVLVTDDGRSITT